MRRSSRLRVVDVGDFSFANFDSDSKETVTALLASEIDRLYPARDPNAQSLKADLRDVWRRRAADPHGAGSEARGANSRCSPAFSRRWRRNAVRFRRVRHRRRLHPKRSFARGVESAGQYRPDAVTAPTLPINDAMQDDLERAARRPGGQRHPLVHEPRNAGLGRAHARRQQQRLALRPGAPYPDLCRAVGQALALEPIVFEPNVAQTWASGHRDDRKLPARPVEAGRPDGPDAEGCLLRRVRARQHR